jgi:hypothetical protein
MHVVLKPSYINDPKMRGQLTPNAHRGANPGVSSGPVQIQASITHTGRRQVEGCFVCRVESSR